MNDEEKRRVADLLSDFASGESIQDPAVGERKLFELVKPLLAADGYDATLYDASTDTGVDVVARRPYVDGYDAEQLLLELKYRRTANPLYRADIRKLLDSPFVRSGDRVVVVTNTAISPGLRDELTRDRGVSFEALGLEELRAWFERATIKVSSIAERMLQVVRDASRRFAELVAENPRALDTAEWRDLERIVAEVFGGLGFTVELTPGSKDGGKDVVLECLVRGERKTYIVEVKHWRSGNRVGSGVVAEFVNVVARESRDGGLILSSSGYTGDAFEALSEIERERVRFGREEKVVSLCRHYVRARNGLWSPPAALPDVIFEHTA